MYSYNISKETDEKVFFAACQIIEDALGTASKEKLLIDVDGTMIQIYHTPNGKIKVLNDYEVDAVYIDSDVDLSAFFGGEVAS